ncbi:MAG: glycosyltransferase [Patescibacteria group bacterium]
MDLAKENRPKIAVIVPALNEEMTVGQVVSTLKRSPFLDEVIVVSSGSSDRTAAIARKNGAIVYEPPANGSKGASLLFGLSKTDAPIIVFCDADLKGLTINHVQQLVQPLINGKRTMNIGLRDRGALITNITKHLPLIAGERALRREVIENIDPKFLKGYMVETALNYYCRIKKLNYGVTPLRGLKIRKKIEKVGFWQGCREYINMDLQVLKAMIIVRLAYWCGKF